MRLYFTGGTLVERTIWQYLRNKQQQSSPQMSDTVLDWRDRITRTNANKTGQTTLEPTAGNE